VSRHQPWNLDAIRSHFVFPSHGRVVTNNAASTQPPRALLQLFHALAPAYDNVHRGQSDASQITTERFESAYDDIARFIGAPSRRNIVVVRNTTEAHNTVMYSLMSEFRDGDNVVTTMMEHNSNYVPWYAMCRDILPRFGRRVQYRLARFDPSTGELDLEHLASLIDHRTKLVCCTGASNFFGTKTPLSAIRALADRSGYAQPGGEQRSYLLVDGAQLVPGTFVDVQQLDVDYLSFSFHKMLAPFGVGVLYGKEHLLRASLPFLYGGDMIAEGQVFPDRVDYNALPWKFAAGTPNILGTIVSAQALRLLVDLVDATDGERFFDSERPLPRDVVERSMSAVRAHTQAVTGAALSGLLDIDGLRLYGPEDPSTRAPLAAFNVRGVSPFQIAEELSALGVESRAGCHCATLAHRDLALDPAASCRLSFALYNSMGDVTAALSALDQTLRTTLTQNGASAVQGRRS
jgi:cysteine desulfurase/selenocysteine lyase